MATIEPLLDSKRMQEIFDYSESTLDRRVRAAKAGLIRFPLPLAFGDGGKRERRWNAAQVRAFIDSQTQLPVQPPVSSGLTAEEQQELDAALNSLSKDGIRIGNAIKGRRAKT